MTVDAGSGIVRMAHYTEQEFFERTRHRQFPAAQRTIMTSCLQRLSFNTLCRYRRTTEDMEEPPHSQRFLAYAASFSGHHPRCRFERNVFHQVIGSLCQTRASSLAPPQELLLLVCGWETKPTALEEAVSGLNLAACFGLDHNLALLL